MIMITMVKIMLKVKINIKKISFLTIAITITTNKTLITDKTLTGEKKQTIILFYYIQTTFSNMQRKRHVH